MKTKICITADIHFERVLKEEDGYDNMVRYFKYNLECIKPDIFIIAGDLTDSRNLRFETPEAARLIDFMKEILDITKKYNIITILLKGTPSHDGEIAKNLTFLTDKYDNYIYVDSMSRGMVRGLNVLYIPEIYRPTYAEFNTELTDLVNESNKVDLIIFHGMFDFAINAVKQVDSKHNLSRSIVMDSSHLSKLCSIALGGHVHSYMSEKNIFYVGRFINERGHDYRNDTYGMKYVELNDGRYMIKNIDNPYVIKQDISYINLIKYDIDDENVRQACVPYINDPKKCIYYIIMDNSAICKERFKRWKDTYNPLYVRKVMQNKDSDLSVKTEKTAEITSNTDLRALLKDMYKTTYGEDLPDKIVDMIERGDDYES